MNQSQVFNMKIENSLRSLTKLSLDNGFIRRVYPTLISKPNLRKTAGFPFICLCPLMESFEKTQKIPQGACLTTS